ncbi:AfsR/SARP family transcriptional regulator [Actinoplanes teichomyceticus]|uniref:AfsR/SARP family transcriptional regulator n=1 Tax=Actinoplanes teichomyceticus TaxID=1867 RepID=UPI000F0A1902|nr:AfsR/SARP family transcriptional regulator [Actinoplanes teichomyceticus]
MNIWMMGQMLIESGHRSTRFRGGMQGALLAVLISAQGQVMPFGTLSEELWGGRQPDGMENALQAHASRLRRKLRALEPERAEARLVARAGGYRLDLDGAATDAITFASEVAAVQADPGLPPAVVSQRLRAVLSLWRGQVFGGAPVGMIAQAWAARLSAVRIAALEMLFDNELKLGLHSAIVPELSALVRSEALNERWCEQLMVALYRSGRQAEALGVYQRMRQQMIEELGVDPSPMLRNHERAILAHDDGLLIHGDHRLLRAVAR